MKKFILFIFMCFFPFVASAITLPFHTIFAEVLGNNVVSEIYAMNASCWTCGYILDIIDLFSGISLAIFEDLSFSMIILLGISLVGYIVYKMFTGFFSLSAVTAQNLFKDLAPKFFATIFIIPLLLAPTPKFIYNYMIEPLMDLGSSYGTKVMTIVSDSDTASYCLMQYASSDATNTQNEAFSPTFRQNLICLTSQSHQINAIGLSLGTTLLMSAFKVENLHFGGIPNIEMGASGIILFIAYFIALIVFPLLIIGALFKLGFVLSFLPFVLFSYVITRGGEGISILNNVYKAAVKYVSEASLMMLFLPFMLSLSHIIFQTALDSGMLGYGELVNLVQKGDTEKIIKILAFGTKDMLFLTFVGILNIYLLLSTQEIAKWFGVKYDDKLVEWTKKSATTSAKWVNDKRKAGWQQIQKWRGKVK